MGDLQGLGFPKVSGQVGSACNEDGNVLILNSKA